MSTWKRKSNQDAQAEKKNQFSPGHSPVSFLQNRNKAKELLGSFRQPGPKEAEGERCALSFLYLKPSCE